ncbi:MAG: hypothetical protein ACI8T1_002051 [Verrucomicrobiales bacterium]|jgi:hypothetical protein
MFQSAYDSVFFILIVAFCTSAFGQELPDKDWWSFKAMERPSVPKLGGEDAQRARTVIDHFIIAKQRELGLGLSREADKRTLIRRLYFNLIGLPPSPEEVTAFVNNSDPKSYEKLVEGLLESPRYGERWARHWLDVVHYGDTHGYDKDKLRPNAYPYRDYVIRAFNDDKPYSQFVREQLAGDVLWPDTQDGIVATGFIAAGPWDFIGHAEVPEEKYDGMVARHLDRDDMVSTTMNTFCSLTVQCAQCHDHKRDPVTMEDYYGLQAVFAALDRADRPYDDDPATAKKRRALTETQERLQEQLKETDREIQASKPEALVVLEKEMASLESEGGAGKSSGQLGYHSQVAGKQDTVKWVQVDFGKSIPLDHVILAGAQEYGFADFGFPHRFRIEASDHADFKDSQVITDQTQSDYPRPGANFTMFEAQQVQGRYVRVTATRLWSRRHKGQPETSDWIFAMGELAVVSDGKLADAKEVTALDSIEALPRWGKMDLIDGYFGSKGKKASVEDLMKESTSHLASLQETHESLLKSSIDPRLLEQRESLQKQSDEVGIQLKALPEAKMAYVGTVHKGGGAFKGRGHLDGKPRPIHVLARGDVRNPLKEVVAGAVHLPKLSASFKLSENHGEGERRVALAEWIVNRDNPLTWRTIVNRVWLYHFGQGIVDSPNDFGRLGQLPTHPQLLDWLAVEFRDGDQSIKDLHRLIVNSAVYKQTSAGNAEAAVIDGGNQFLWRMSRRKLEAEALRDSVLLVSGKLDTTMYGPGFRDFVLEKPEHSPHYQYHKHDPDDVTTHRRSVYRFLVRSQPQPFMDTLDCADPSLMVDKRNETLTALQALALLNNKFVVRMAEHFATRLEGAKKDRREQIALAYQLTISRAPTDEEVSALVDYADKHGLPSACRVILNLNEFAFAD